ncbi:MAG TPA: ketoacyl-synthetase C-terminal extension domain-containing protein, partial [Conexibacter sp.]|nr:ketoacyl-synthetase C-terminal extension domain-containing protein [Conexibacter sp.]
GHAQAAAGAGGVIKMALALQHETLPRTLHVDAPTPHVDWSAGAVSLLTEARAWPRGERPRRAGVSSFGISGTNAHLIVEEAPPEPAAANGAPPPDGPFPLLVSAQTPEALRAHARRLREHLAAHANLDPADVAGTLARRARFEHRAVAAGRDRAELLAALERLVDGADPHAGGPDEEDRLRAWAGARTRHVELPTYPFQRRRYWLEAPTLELGARNGAAAARTREAASGDAPAAAQTHEPAPARAGGGGADDLLALVRGEAAAVLGHDAAEDVRPDRTLLELGFDSMGSVALHRRLSAASGVALPATLILDEHTPASLADLLERLREAGAPAAPAAATGLVALLREAHRAGRLLDAVPLATTAASLRPAFAAGEAGTGATATLVADGAASPQLVAIPSFMAGSGAHQFVRLAAALGTPRRVTALGLPGFRAGERLPASGSAAVASLAGGARAAADGEPWVLVGYSSGGLLAHAVAEALAAQDAAPRGLVLLDTFDPTAPDQAELLAWATGELLEREHAYVALDDEQLIAMGAYVRLREHWRPGAATPVPTLLVQAQRRAGRWPGWAIADTAVAVGADHFSLLIEDAAATAQAIEAWLPAAGGER